MSTAGRIALLVSVALFAACRDAVAPAGHEPGPAATLAAAASGTGITLDQTTGVLPDAVAWPAGGTHIGKDFPTNPHLGDAIVATFFWRGTTNTIITVSDHFCDANSTPIGNTYTLVEYVTAGGYSMATYVATNVQGFPDPATTAAQKLCVHAIFSNSFSEGGMILSAYQGVNTVTASALGAHHSAVGSGSATTVANPGAIAIGAGALAYAVTMANGVAGTDPPAGFAYVQEAEDNALKADGEYEVVPSAGTVDPTWNWYFTSSHTWLATTLALNPAGGTANQPPTAAFTSSCSTLTCTFTSTSSDPDGSISAYSWTFGDGGTSTSQNPSHTYGAGGTYTVTLKVTDNQGATNSVSHSVTVTAGNQAPVAAFTSSCSGPTCAFTSTSSDPDGSISAYSWTFGDGGTSTAQNPSHTYGAGGTYTVTLTVTDNQGATNSVSHSVTVTSGSPPPVSITLDQTTGVLPDAEAWPAGGTRVGKDFPTNPHLGDAIVATFFWRGTTNTITTVTDHFCDVNNTPIGNTYTLVEYVTAGGYSMATYVATNVQGFPDPATTSDQHLCVHAIFSNSFTEGGMILSAYQGVNAVTASALGAHHSAVGSGSATTVANPGAIAIGAGALAYAVTLANGVVGMDPPPGFANVQEAEDNSIKADGEYEVVSAPGTVDPTWNWYFTSSHAWLATVLALNPASP
jgi:PKD repeat protein